MCRPAGRLTPTTAREGKSAAEAARPARAAPLTYPSGFVAKMYGLNVAQGREQYSTKFYVCSFYGERAKGNVTHSV